MNHVMDVKIYYEDTDCGGVVYYANYLRYMERARTEYLASKGLSVRKLMDEGTIFIVLRVEIDYKSPARYGDTVEIETWVRDVSRATMLFEHIMREKSSGRVFVECRAKMAYVNPTGRPKRLPAEMVEKLK
ncbi:MAG TPA: YbgC/FadM family acyl-CoA thioesterase [Nitrospirota bacterium]|nr:YbgC/FadM family acyl-CoA thioesterase [Nitrospirota bacterium]